MTMTVTLMIFSALFVGCSLAASLLTEAVKKWYENAKKDYSANAIALVLAVVVGGFGTAIAYTLLGIPWTVNNIICLGLMVVAIWVGAMVGYDKVIQMLKQLAELKEKQKQKEVESNDNSTADNK
jgi:uncharacterized protein YacL